MLIVDSQGKELDIANFNVLLLPGACVRHVYHFIPKKDSYDTVVLFIAGNYLLCNNVPSAKYAEVLTQELSDLANFLLTRLKVILFLAYHYVILYLRDLKL